MDKNLFNQFILALAKDYKEEQDNTTHINGCTIRPDETDNTYTVNTPISRETGFKTEAEATRYAETYGQVDLRTT